MPEPGSSGSNLNESNLMVFTHEDHSSLQPDTVRQYTQAFLALPFNDPSSDEWEDLDSSERTRRFLDYMHLQGYTVFNPSRIQYCI